MQITLRALQPHRAGGIARRPGDLYVLEEQRARVLLRLALAELYAGNGEGVVRWHDAPGRELRTSALPDSAAARHVVACVSIWNDRAALEQTLPTWIEHVDALVVADGAYAPLGLTEPWSDDGLIPFLAVYREQLLITIVPPADGQSWPDQNAKRTRLLAEAARLYPDALLFIVDADERVEHAEALRAFPAGDVGWVSVNSPLYRRSYGQPRLVRARPDLHYRGRHHWLYTGDQLLATHQYGGPGFEHRVSAVHVHNDRGLGHSPERAALKQRHLELQSGLEAVMASGLSGRADAAVGARESLRIVQLTSVDPGLVAYRLHTAINATTPHASLLARQLDNNPFAGPTQYVLPNDAELVRRALLEADVVHCHMSDRLLQDLRPPGMRAKVVMHHHGTMYRLQTGEHNRRDAQLGALRLVSNLELLQYGKDLHFLPNPVPVARYRRLRAREYAAGGKVRGEPFRIAHSPSKRHLKGTAEFLEACEALQARGLPVEPVLIEGLPHAEALRLKASCDACFDSFWLGIQCSGLEAGAMGMPVIAGDAFVAEGYQTLFGGAPYTFADDRAQLEAVFERLVTDPVLCAREALRVSEYVLRHHDEAAVALRYLDLLDEAFGWRTALQVSAPPPPNLATTTAPRRGRRARATEDADGAAH